MVPSLLTVQRGPQADDALDREEISVEAIDPRSLGAFG